MTDGKIRLRTILTLAGVLFACVHFSSSAQAASCTSTTSGAEIPPVVRLAEPAIIPFVVSWDTTAATAMGGISQGFFQPYNNLVKTPTGFDGTVRLRSIGDGSATVNLSTTEAETSCVIQVLRPLTDPVAMAKVPKGDATKSAKTELVPVTGSKVPASATKFFWQVEVRRTLDLWYEFTVLREDGKKRKTETLTLPAGTKRFAVKVSDSVRKAKLKLRAYADGIEVLDYKNKVKFE